MGLCETNNKNNQIHSIKTLMKNYSTKNIKKNMKRNDFFYFTEWILTYKFYKHLSNNKDNSTRLITTQNDPNEFNIFKIIKAIDQIQGKNFREYSINNPNFSSSKSQSQSTLYKSNRSNSDDNFNDLRLNINGLFDKLNMIKFKKLQKILIRGPPNNLRWLLWISIARNKYLEIDSKFENGNSQIYNELLNLNCSKDLEKKIKEDCEKLVFFKNNNWNISVMRILKAFSIYDQEIKYTSQLCNIVKNILIVSDFNEEESFLFLRYFFSSSYGLSLRNFYFDNSFDLNLYSFFVEELIKERLPKIDQTIKRLKIEIKDWIQIQLISLFENIFDFSITVRLWDCLIVLGKKFLLNFSLSFFKLQEEAIINFKTKDDFQIFEQKILFKKDNKASEYREKIIKEALNINISNATIKRMEEIYQFEYNMLKKNTILNKKENNELTRINKIMKNHIILYNESLSEEEHKMIHPIENLENNDSKNINIINELLKNNNNKKIENIEPLNEMESDETISVNESYDCI